MRKLFLFLTASLLLFSCVQEHVEPSGNIDAYIPVYSTLSEIHKISLEQKEPTLNAGKIYAFRNYIFQNDLFSGIHIIDNSDRANPVKVAFLKLPLNTDIAIRGDYLYANNYVDLVVFDVSDPAHIQLVKRVADVFPATDQNYPPFKNVYFLCPDKSKGIVVRWEIKNISIPNCRR
jgi:hypothetical protein